MKICVSTVMGGMDDMVHPLFGRAPTFTFVSVVNGKITGYEVFPNDYSGAAGGAGVQCAQFVIKHDAGAVISGRFGPHAYEALKDSGIDMVTAGDMPVKDAVLGYLKGTVKPMKESASARQADHGIQVQGPGIQNNLRGK
ncbi:MAG: NifB/NifX family molybdenum-iron cluster-binding protein [Candidatus Altiarchaeia archaeon]